MQQHAHVQNGLPQALQQPYDDLTRIRAVNKSPLADLEALVGLSTGCGSLRCMRLRVSWSRAAICAFELFSFLLSLNALETLLGHFGDLVTERNPTALGMNEVTPDPCSGTPEGFVTLIALDCGVRRGRFLGVGMGFVHKHMLENVVVHRLGRHSAYNLSQISTDAEKPPRSPAKCAVST